MGLKYEKVHEWSGEEEITKVSLNSIPKRRRTLFFGESVSRQHTCISYDFQCGFLFFLTCISIRSCGVVWWFAFLWMLLLWGWVLVRLLVFLQICICTQFSARCFFGPFFLFFFLSFFFFRSGMDGRRHRLDFFPFSLLAFLCCRIGRTLLTF